MRILLVEDSARVADVVEAALRTHGHAVTVAESRRAAADAFERASFDLGVIDVGLPDGSGLDLCRAIRAGGQSLPLLVLTARNDIDDRVAGLDAGADDYLGKPFSTDELLARVRALGRRGPSWTESRRRFGELEIDRDRRSIVRAGEPIALTPREFDVVALLAFRDGRIVGRDEILEAIWGEVDERASASLDVLLTRIRRKLRRHDGDEVIRTVRSAGYAWVPVRSKAT